MSNDYSYTHGNHYTNMVMAGAESTGYGTEGSWPSQYGYSGYDYSAYGTTSAQPVPQVPVKRYTHNPYASEPSTPTSNSFAGSATSSFNTSADSVTTTSTTASTSYTPVYAPEGSYSDATSYPVAHMTTEQFNGMCGAIAANACTVRGRHLLLNVMKLQHVDKIQMIFDEIVVSLRDMIMNTNGCHVVRTLVEYLNDNQLAMLAHYLTPELVNELATTSQHTRRILQTLFERHKSSHLDSVVFELARNCKSVSCTQQGCIAIMRLVEHGLPHQQATLLEALSPHLASLAMDPYGNYVVQSIVQHTDPLVASATLSVAFEEKWMKLACNKFASNVLEKLLRVLTIDARSQALEAIVFTPEALHTVIHDGFGNFVLQAIIESSNDSNETKRIAELVRPMLAASPYGHKIEAKLKAKRC